MPRPIQDQPSGLVFQNKKRAFAGYLKLNCNFYDESGNALLKYSDNYCHLLPRDGLIFWASPHKIGLSNLNKIEIWSKPIRGHHDFYVDEDAGIGLVVMRRKSIHAKSNSSANPSEIWHDGVESYDLKGNKIFSWYSDEAIDQIGQLLNSSAKRIEDTYYVNPDGLAVGIKINSATLITNHPFRQHFKEFADGNVLLSLNRLGLLIIVEPKSGSIVWSYQIHHGNSLSGGAHYIRLLDNGNALYIENYALYQPGLPPTSNNAVTQAVELDLTTKRRVWTYPRDPKNGFHNPDGCSAIRLENGNTLVAYDYAARILEVTSEGEIVWDWAISKPEGSQSVDLMGASKISKATFEQFLLNAKSKK